MDSVGASVSILFRSLCSPLRLLPTRVTLAQHHQPPIRDRHRPRSRYTGLIIGVSIGTILLLFLASVLYARFVNSRREASQGRTERARIDEELTITPLTARSPTLASAPPPYENPPSFEDAVKRTQTTGVSRPGEEQERDGVAA